MKRDKLCIICKKDMTINKAIPLYWWEPACRKCGLTYRDIVVYLPDILNRLSKKGIHIDRI